MKREFLTIAVLFFFLSVFSFVSHAQGAEVKPVELKIMHFGSPEHFIHKDVFVPWAKMLEERTGGRVKGVIYPSELLGKLKDSYDITVAGVADICWAFIMVTPGRFPLHNVYELPLLFPNAKVGSLVAWENFDKEASLRAEFSDVKVLWIHTSSPIQLHTTKKPIRSLEDLKGMKIRTLGGVTISTIKALGAIPVGISTPDLYSALERGTVDGTTFPWEGIKSFRLHEVTKFHTQINIIAGIFYVVMNKKRWESLSPDIQKTIDGLSGAWAADRSGTAWDKADTNAIEMVKGLSGHEIINLSPEELAKWRNAIKPVWDGWVLEMEAKGLPGRKILDEVLRLREKYPK